MTRGELLGKIRIKMQNDDLAWGTLWVRFLSFVNLIISAAERFSAITGKDDEVLHRIDLMRY
ncbi:hypothetical protein BL250_01705 [Erwinia sp. OLTSP20]|nr:hypothetical protein BV501_05905 [Erwinia sp. OAMSP11]PIJ73699.1 hypothetical protein BK416_06195 [Erwinia sp. OLSSP12]PIJ83056.1 hypothetical protein BLD47_05690 [Erwinia sp. OLCASP19]PIJ85655.1 hypothetical protein BLD46_05720 [Erwinia sp. OLMTSP26]PIJ87696.1 hypothetical protein BLD49_05395 [Erwinia sp. OLMDSP33]PIJ94748.1 hypothetical protein BL249_01765 [Erwinia sp. OLFS4]PIJ95051.1 hypothetical protein BL250_01705 [Erwinia sp. OLTSP20]